jgi:hypothetical protein
LDGTLAEWSGYKGETHIGKPIPKMVSQVKQWLAEGQDVHIFTARAKSKAAIDAIKDWSKTHLGVVLPVTNVKSSRFSDIYDDRAHRVERNTGRILDKKARAKAMA